MKGQGVPPDYAAAMVWFRKSADQGFAPAQRNLGVLYANGQGAPRNNVQAYKWVSLAMVNATTPDIRNAATRAKEQIVVFMTAAQIAEAEKQAKAWKPVPPKS